jgi:hypothetical protein
LHRAVLAFYAPTAQAAKRFDEYFAADIRHPNTERVIYVRFWTSPRGVEAQNLT